MVAIQVIDNLPLLADKVIVMIRDGSEETEWIVDKELYEGIRSGKESCETIDATKENDTAKILVTIDEKKWIIDAYVLVSLRLYIFASSKDQVKYFK